MRHIKFWLLIWTFLVSFGLAVSATGGQALAAAPTPFGQFRWREAHATYYIGSTSSYYRGIFQRAVRIWNQNTAFKLVKGTKRHHQLLLTTTASTRGSYAELAGIAYEDHSATGYYTSAQVYLMRTNLKAYGYSKGQRQAVAEHEVGHTLGLDHSSDALSVMLAGNRNNRQITAADQAAVRLRYQTPAWQASTD